MLQDGEKAGGADSHARASNYVSLVSLGGSGTPGTPEPPALQELLSSCAMN